MSEEHEHICPKCKEVYSCTDDCFHHYGVPHVICAPKEKETIVVGGY